MPTAAAPIYRPRHPERTGLYRLFEQHFDRFEHAHGPLRANVQRVVEQYLNCGPLHGGFARLRCPRCRGEHLIA